MRTASVTTSRSHLPLGFKPRTLNRFEEQIGEAWEFDTVAVYAAMTAWIELSAKNSTHDSQELLIEAWEVVRNSRQRRISPIAACDELREFMRDRGLDPP